MKREKTDSIIIHCSASSFGSFELIDQWHKERGWNGCGYHFVILNGKTGPGLPWDKRWNGTIERGRDVDEIGAHCRGQNKTSIGICLIGNHCFSYEQFKSLAGVIEMLQKQYRQIGVLDIKPHLQFNPSKTCPNFDLKHFIEHFCYE
ncbi:MAG: N-acetylmuramoyl-L-alanine amidase [Proteobacteria bacterium]|nr:N-acetylmuramoyl-L-alanine amidase [Pseudomonadota bacterium]